MKALLAEDDPYTRQALATILETDGWEVLACADGRNALANFGQGGFDLICLDIMMPQLSGYDVCREIRRLDRTVPILFISAKSEEIDTVLGLELGADDFIVKPFGVRELQARIRAVLRRSAPGGEKLDGPQVSSSAANSPDLSTSAITRLPPFMFGPWEIRPAELRAHRLEDTASRGEPVAPVELGPREVAILDLLVRSPGIIVTREEFFRQCWRLEHAPLSRTLDQHIARLRKKLEAPGVPRLILTAQGLGYRYQP